MTFLSNHVNVKISKEAILLNCLIVNIFIFEFSTGKYQSLDILILELNLQKFLIE